jgi:hypothetical protein
VEKSDAFATEDVPNKESTERVTAKWGEAERLDGDKATKVAANRFTSVFIRIKIKGHT